MYAIIFTIIAILALIGLILLLFWRVQADDVNQNVNIEVNAPEWTQLYAWDNQGSGTYAGDTSESLSLANNTGGVETQENDLVLVEDDYNKISYSGTVADLNGTDQIIDPTYHEFVTKGPTYGPTCVPGDATNDPNGCWVEASSAANTTVTAIDPNTVTVEHAPGWELDPGVEQGAEIGYWVPASDLGDLARVQAQTTDETLEVGAYTVDFYVAPLVALTFDDPNVGFGTLNLGALSAEQALTVRNTGNKYMNPDFLALDDFNCETSAGSGIPSGSFSADVVEIGENTGFTYGVDGKEVDLAIGDDGVDDNKFIFGGGVGLGTAYWNLGALDTSGSTGDMFLQLQLPSTGFYGVCTNQVQYTAVEALS